MCASVIDGVAVYMVALAWWLACMRAPSPHPSGGQQGGTHKGCYTRARVAQARAISIPLGHPSLFAVAAVAGFATNAFAFAVIKLASSLTLKVRAGRDEV